MLSSLITYSSGSQAVGLNRGGKSFSCVATAVLRLITSPLECPSSFSSADNLCQKLEDLQQFQKREPENEEEVDVLNLSEPLQINIKKEQEEKQEEVKFYLPPTPGAEFIGDITQKVGAAACGAARSQTRCEMLLPLMNSGRVSFEQEVNYT